jgi:glycine/D-amino acid oxidase-like deaminating enzyme
VTLTSIWQDRHPRTADTSAEVGGHWDVLVVGGGLTGVTTALLLGRAGRSVALVEAEHIGFGTTGGSTAKVSLLQGTQLSTIRRKHAASVVEKYVEGNREAQAWVARFCADHGVDVQHRPACTYANAGHGESQVRAELEAGQAAGLPFEWRDELPLPYRTRGGVWLEDQLQVDPMELLQALAREAVEHGVHIVEGARVQKVRGSEPVHVETDHGSATADRVVIGTNIPILDRGGFFARMKPSRSYGLAFRTDTQAVDAMYLSIDSPSRSLRDAPAQDGHVLLVGGNGHTTGRTGSTELRLEELRAWTAEYWPGAVETHAWSAQDFIPHHSLPFAGPLLPGSAEILMAGGYMKWGMTNAVAASLALSAQILGGHVEWAEAWRTWSSHSARGLGMAALYNGEVGLEMTRGWMRPLLRPGAGAVPQEGDGVVRADRAAAPTATSRVGGVERRVSAVCTHMGGIVRWNDAERSWDCPLHGSRFGPNGEVLSAPAVCGLKPH